MYEFICMIVFFLVNLNFYKIIIFNWIFRFNMKYIFPLMKRCNGPNCKYPKFIPVDFFFCLI